jgi:AcrR family transcriptional regulator
MESQPSTVEPVGRRARNRAARHDQLLAAAMEIVAEHGLDGLTMQGVADKVDCAVGTIYTYFSSKSALVAALQTAAVQTMLATYHRCAQSWDDALVEMETEDHVAALVRIMGFCELFVAGPQIHPREFELLQLLITARGQVIATEDLLGVLPHVMALLTEARVLIDEAMESGALAPMTTRPDDDSLRRTLRLAGGLDGALLVGGAGVPGVPEVEAFESRRLAQLLTEDLLLAWGAQPRTLELAVERRERLRAAGVLLPEPQETS